MFCRPFDLISIIYANFQDLLCNFVALAFMSLVPSSIKIRVNVTKKKQFTSTRKASQPEGVENDASIKPPNLSQPEGDENDAAIFSFSYPVLVFKVPRLSWTPG